MMFFQFIKNASPVRKRIKYNRLFVFVALCFSAPILFNSNFYLNNDVSLELKVISLVFLAFIQVLTLSLFHDIRLQRLIVCGILGAGALLAFQRINQSIFIGSLELHRIFLASGDILVFLFALYLAYTALTVRFHEESRIQRVQTDVTASLFFLVVLCVIVGSTYLSTMKSVIAVRESKVTLSPYAEFYEYFVSTKHKYLLAPSTISDYKVDKSHRDQSRIGILFIDDGVRANNLSINGYQRQTTPLLEKRSMYNFLSVRSCDTSSSKSIPCILSIMNEDEFSKMNSSSAPTLVDALEETGVNVLLVDGTEDINKLEKEVSRVLNDLSNRVGEDTLIVYIHPGSDINRAPYNKYNHPEIFTPSCSSQSLLSCTKAEIINSYDNSIYNTDTILNKAIDLLNVESVESFLFYTSDHGESLGEYGLFGHGLPKFIAPFDQTYVPLFVWASDNLSIHNIDNLKKCKLDPLNHDVVAHTVLSFFDVASSVIDENKNLLVKRCRYKGYQV